MVFETPCVRENLGRIMGRIRNEIKKKKEEAGWIEGKDFNLRTREKGALEDGEEGKVRNSKNLVVNRWGEELIRWREKGWNIMNDKEGDREGEVTFPRERGEIVIDCDSRQKDSRMEGNRKTGSGG